MMKSVRIATRRSRLALVQARSVAARLGESGRATELVPLATRGDEDATAAPKDGKAAFIDALEEALTSGRADIAVHSMKDVPAERPKAFALAAWHPRADARDALVLPAGTAPGGLDRLAAGARVGTSSARRAAMLRSLLSDVEVAPVRGNVDTRLRRLDDGRFDALLLACAGLDRLELGERIAQRIDLELLVPAPGQGALAVEHLAEREDLAALLGGAAGREQSVSRCVAAERQTVRRLGADCALPVGVHCMARGDELRLLAAVANPQGTRLLRVEQVGTEPMALGEAVAARLDALGAQELIAEPCASG